MDNFAVSREEGLRRALSLAIPVGTQLGSIGIESLGRAADGTLKLATWSVTSAVRTAGASAAFVNRNVLAPLSSFAFGSSSSSPGHVHFRTQSCPQQLLQKGRKHHPSEVRYQRAANNLRSGSAKCAIRRQQQPASVSSPFAAQQAELLAHLAASCALTPSSDMQDEFCLTKDNSSVAQWTVNTLGLQSSML